MAESHGERTFEATDQRREQFRKDGRFAQAKDLGGLAATIAAVGALVAARTDLASALQTLFARSIGDLVALDRLGAYGALRSAAAPTLAALAPVLVASAILATLAAGAQTKFRPNFDAVGLKIERLDPQNGFARLFAFRKNAVQLLISLMRTAAVGVVTYKALQGELPILMSISRAPAAAAAVMASGAIGRVVAASLVALAIIAGIDYAYSWFSLEGEMKMTRQERVDEAKQQDGDPKAKGRMKARARALAKKRALHNVKHADVVVTNPTHVAVALRYGPRDPAPVVLAKGHDEVALRIRAEARKHGIPILENRPLARALDAAVPVGRPIPQTHFAAVAQVLAFVYRLKRRHLFANANVNGKR